MDSYDEESSVEGMVTRADPGTDFRSIPEMNLTVQKYSIMRGTGEISSKTGRLWPILILNLLKV
jgi:hypothetical protein